MKKLNAEQLAKRIKMMKPGDVLPIRDTDENDTSGMWYGIECLNSSISEERIWVANMFGGGVLRAFELYDNGIYIVEDLQQYMREVMDTNYVWIEEEEEESVPEFTFNGILANLPNRPVSPDKCWASGKEHESGAEIMCSTQEMANTVCEALEALLGKNLYVTNYDIIAESILGVSDIKSGWWAVGYGENN